MKQKIIAALKTKYQRFGLSNEAVDRIASAKEKTVTTDEEIEGAIADAQTMELIANELQKSADKERRDRSNLQKSFDEYKEKHPDSEPSIQAPAPVNDQEPEWARKLREQQEAIAARFAREDQEKALKATRLTVEAKLKAKIADNAFNQGVFNSALKGFSLGENESLEEAVERIKGEYDASYKETFGNGPLPGVGTPAFGDAKSAVSHKNDFLREQGLLPTQEK